MASRTGSGTGPGGLTSAVAYDVAVLGGGPAGSAAAAAASRMGMRVILIERAVFPRHKVCGDCLNPRCWPVLERLGADAAVRNLAPAPVREVEFVRGPGKATVIPLPDANECVVARERFDSVLLGVAVLAGVRLMAGSPVSGLTRRSPEHWTIATGDGDEVESRCVIAADGRNSTACRLLNLSPPARSRRVGIQTHADLPDHPGDRISLRLLSKGYCGIAPLGDGRVNVCIVSKPDSLTAARHEVAQETGLDRNSIWHSIAPLERAAIDPAPANGLFLAGDAARVLEPFTGEGIALALETGLLAAEAARRYLECRGSAGWYRQEHAQFYRSTGWLNRLTRAAVTSPRLGRVLLAAGAQMPCTLRWLTAKVVTRRKPVPGNS